MGIDDRLEIDSGAEISSQELLGLDELLERSRQGSPADDLRELRAFLVRMPMLGPYNAALVQVQRPGAHYVADRATWAREFHRRVLPGARPLIILRPFAPVDLVYDIADTDGAPVPDRALHPFRLDGEVTEQGLAAFTALLPREGILYREEELGSQQAGSVQAVEPPLLRGTGPRAIAIRHCVVVGTHLDPTARLVTVFHELAHVFARHVDHHTRTGVRPARPLSRRSQEFEAEIAAWLVAARLGIESPAGEYLAGYVDEDGSVPPYSLQAVVSAAGRIESVAGGLEKLARLAGLGREEAPHGPAPQQGALDLDLLTPPEPER